MRIYIAGKYTPRQTNNNHTAIQQIAKNVDKAKKAGIKLINKGHKPFIPHLNYHIHTHPNANQYGDKWWYNYDNTFLRHWAEAIYLLDNWKDSPGAKNEKQLAEKLNLKIYHNMKNIPNKEKNTDDQFEKELKKERKKHTDQIDEIDKHINGGM